MTILSRLYPLHNFDSLCRNCKGSPLIFFGKPKCILCKRTKSDWLKAGFETEIKEMLYFLETWKKCRDYKQESTGIHDLDCVIVHIFGMPHSGFGKQPPRKMPAKVEAYTPDYVQGPIHLPKDA